MIKRFITSILSLLLILLVGTPQRPNDLHKQPTTNDLKEELKLKVNCWIQMNIGYIALAIIVFLLIVFVYACFALVGVSAVESGTYYNHFGGVI